MDYDTIIIFIFINLDIWIMMLLIFFVFFVVLAVIRAESFREPILLPPRIPSHLFTDIITVVDTESGNAMPLVKSGSPLHDLYLFICLFKHLFNAWKLEFLIC